MASVASLLVVFFINLQVEWTDRFKSILSTSSYCNPWLDWLCFLTLNLFLFNLLTYLLICLFVCLLFRWASGGGEGFVGWKRRQSGRGGRRRDGTSWIGDASESNQSPSQERRGSTRRRRARWSCFPTLRHHHGRHRTADMRSWSTRTQKTIVFYSSSFFFFVVFTIGPWSRRRTQQRQRCCWSGGRGSQSQSI